MKKLLIIFFSFPLLVISQNWKTVPDVFNTQCKASFIDEVNRGSKRLQDLPSNDERFWLVYSDRENNRLKNRANGFYNGAVLDYMEALYVKEVSDNWLHVYGAENEDDKGWIEAKYLLLSLYSLKTEGDVSVPRKAIILTSLDDMISGGIDMDDVLEQKHYYDQPDPKNGTKIGTPNSFTIMFVMKEQNGSVLLSNTDVLNSSILMNKSLVYGWMPKFNITKWNSRVALEPSRSAEAIKEYSGQKLPGYKDLKKLESCIENNFCDKENRFVEFKVGDTVKLPKYPLINPVDGNLQEIFSIVFTNRGRSVCTFDTVRLDKYIYINHGSSFPEEGIILSLMQDSSIIREEALDFLDRTSATIKSFLALDYHGNGINALEPVVLLTKIELNTIQRSLSKMMEYNGSIQDIKQNFEQCLILIHKSILGQNMSTSSIENMTLNQFWKKVFGVDYYFKPLRDIYLYDIGSITKNDFRRFYKEFETVARDFCNNNYSHTDKSKSRQMIINGDMFYWIPLEDLPGCKFVN